MFKKYILCVLFLIFCFSASAQNQEELTIDQFSVAIKVKLRSFDTKFIRLNRIGFVDRISFEAKQCKMSKGEKIVSMSVNGHQFVETSIKSQGWRTYVLTFADYSRDLELKASFESGCVYIRNINILARRYSQRGHVGDHISNGTDAFYEVQYLKSITDYLYHSVTASDRVRYLDPLTIIISNALSILETSSGLSISARQAVEQIVQQLSETQPLIEQILKTPNNSDVGRELLLVKRRLAKLLEI